MWQVTLKKSTWIYTCKRRSILFIWTFKNSTEPKLYKWVNAHWSISVCVFIIYVCGLMELSIMRIRGDIPLRPRCVHPCFFLIFIPTHTSLLICLSYFLFIHLQVKSSVFFSILWPPLPAHLRSPLFILSPPMYAPHSRTRGPAASAGQCHAGRHWHVPADGRDGEAGSAPCPGGGEGSLLHLHWLPSTRRGEERELDECRHITGTHRSLSSRFTTPSVLFCRTERSPCWEK